MGRGPPAGAPDLPGRPAVRARRPAVHLGHRHPPAARGRPRGRVHRLRRRGQRSLPDRGGPRLPPGGGRQGREVHAPPVALPGAGLDRGGPRVRGPDHGRPPGLRPRGRRGCFPTRCSFSLRRQLSSRPAPNGVGAFQPGRSSRGAPSSWRISRTSSSSQVHPRPPRSSPREGAVLPTSPLMNSLT